MTATPLRQPGDEHVRVAAQTLFAMRHLLQGFPDPSLRPTGRPGGFAGAKRGNGIEIVDVRPFCDGDDARHIDAATTARTAKVHVRTFRDERDKAALLVADFRGSMLWGTARRLRSVAAAGALALAGWRIVGAGGRVGLLAAGGAEPVHCPPRARDSGMARVVAGLEEAHAAAIRRLLDGRASEPALAAILDTAFSRASSGTKIIVATSLDEDSEALDRLASAALRRFDLTFLIVRDRFERAAPSGAYPYVQSGDRGTGAVRWGTVARGNSARSDDRIEALRASGIAVHVVASDADWSQIALTVGGGDRGRG